MSPNEWLALATVLLIAASALALGCYRLGYSRGQRSECLRWVVRDMLKPPR